MYCVLMITFGVLNLLYTIIYSNSSVCVILFTGPVMGFTPIMIFHIWNPRKLVNGNIKDDKNINGLVLTTPKTSKCSFSTSILEVLVKPSKFIITVVPLSNSFLLNIKNIWKAFRHKKYNRNVYRRKLFLYIQWTCLW